MPYKSEIVQEAARTGYYKHVRSGALLHGQRWVEDQLTGLGHVEGKWDGDANEFVIGYYATIEFFNGYQASLYMTNEQVEKCKGNPENIVLAKLIQTKGLQVRQGEMEHDKPTGNN